MLSVLKVKIINQDLEYNKVRRDKVEDSKIILYIKNRNDSINIQESEKIIKLTINGENITFNP